MATYKSMGGTSYSGSQVEKVGSSYYVKGTSINVSPASSGSSGSGSSSGSSKTTTTSAPKTSSTPSAAQAANNNDYNAAFKALTGNDYAGQYDNNFSGQTIGVKTSDISNSNPAAVVPPAPQIPYSYATNPYMSDLYDMAMSGGVYSPRDSSELQGEASQYANLLVDPQVSNITRQLAQLQSQAEGQRGSINATYSGLSDRATWLLQQAEEAAQHSAISRGGGRSGAVEWETQKYKTPVNTWVLEQESQKAANLLALENALSLSQTQGQDKIQELEKMRGEYTAQRLAALQELESAKAAGDYERATSVLTTLANLDMQQQQLDMNYSLETLPYYTQTSDQQQTSAQTWAEIMGQTQGTTNYADLSSSGAVPLRSYLEGKGASVDWDASTKEVIINGKRYSPQTLKNYGAYMVGDSWYIPESALKTIA